MKRFIPLLALLLLGAATTATAQKTAKKTTRSKTAKKKKTAAAAQPAPNISAESPLMEMEGGKVVYMGATGDQLVYKAKAGSLVYDFIITLRPETEAYRYSFDWEMTAPVNRKGHVDISKAAAYDSKKYYNYFEEGNLIFTLACTMWMTGSNFAEMPEKKTTMQIDNNDPETFYRRDEAETEYKVLYKGKEISLDIFKVDNGKPDGRRQLWIQGISSYPLIVKWERVGSLAVREMEDKGFSIQLKEIK